MLTCQPRPRDYVAATTRCEYMKVEMGSSISKVINEIKYHKLDRTTREKPPSFRYRNPLHKQSNQYTQRTTEKEKEQNRHSNAYLLRHGRVETLRTTPRHRPLPVKSAFGLVML